MKKIEILKNDSYIQIQKNFCEELKSYLTSDVNIIVTNGNLATVLQDSTSYAIDANIPVLEKGGDGRAKLYNLGNFENIQVMVDPYMRWDDNRIFFKNDDTIIEEIEITDNESLLI